MATEPAPVPKPGPDHDRVYLEDIQDKLITWLNLSNNGKDIYDLLHKNHPSRYPKRDDSDEYLKYFDPFQLGAGPGVVTSWNVKLEIDFAAVFQMTEDVYDLGDGEGTPDPEFLFEDYGQYLRGFLDWWEYDGMPPLNKCPKKQGDERSTRFDDEEDDKEAEDAEDEKERPEHSRVTQETVQYEFTSWMMDNNQGKDVYDKLHEKHPDRYPKREDGHDYLYHLNPLQRSGPHEPDINIGVAFQMTNDVYELDMDTEKFDYYAQYLQNFLDWYEFDGSQPLDNHELDTEFKDTIVDPCGYVKTSPGKEWIVNPILKELKKKDDDLFDEFYNEDTLFVALLKDASDDAPDLPEYKDTIIEVLKEKLSKLTASERQQVVLHSKEEIKQKIQEKEKKLHELRQRVDSSTV